MPRTSHPVSRPPLGHTARGMTAVAAVLAMCLAGLALSARPASAAPAPATGLGSLQPDVFENRILAVVNKRRKAADLEPVRSFDPCIDRFAERWARHLAATGDFEHRDQRRILRRCDLTWVGENLIRGSALTPAATVRAWLRSPGHRAVLMKPRANRAGIGVRVDDQGRIVGVLNFGDAD